MLFILYINDIVKCQNCLPGNIILFADDTSIFNSARSIVDTACVVNNELEKTRYMDYSY